MSESKQKMYELRVTIRKTVMDRIRTHTINKYGKTHAVLGVEIENAIELYLDSLENPAHTHLEESGKNRKGKFSEKNQLKLSQTTDNNILYGEQDIPNNGKRSPTKKNTENILKFIVDKYQPTNTTELHDAHFQRAILNMVGGDNRTLNKYMRQLQPYVLKSETGDDTWFMDMDQLTEDGFLK